MEKLNGIKNASDIFDDFLKNIKRNSGKPASIIMNPNTHKRLQELQGIYWKSEKEQLQEKLIKESKLGKLLYGQ